MKLNHDGTCEYRGRTYATFRQALEALWAKN